MAGDGTWVVVQALPECDIHTYEKGEPGVPARYDGKTIRGPWANMCEPCFGTHGIGLGVGRGQRLILPSEPQPLRLRFGLNDVWPEEGPEVAVAVWGCRLIVKQDGYVDFVPDRQDADGPDEPRTLLLELLMQRFSPSHLKDWVEWLLWIGYHGGMLTREREPFVLHMDDELTVVANTNASAGYCYVTAWLSRP